MCSSIVFQSEWDALNFATMNIQMIRRIGIQFIYASLALLAGQDEDDKKQNLNYKNISLPATLISCPWAISKA